MRKLFSFLIFLGISYSAVAQQLDTLVFFDYLSNATEIEIAPDGSLVVWGNLGPSTSDAYYHRWGFLSKYDQEGNLLWEQNGLFDDSESSSMTVDPFGNIYVAYYVYDASKFEMLKYSKDGDLIWEKTVHHTLSDNFQLSPDVLYADEEHLYMGAHYFGKSYFEIDSLDDDEKGPLCLLQYDLDGNAEWIRFLNTTNGDFTGIDSDEEGNVYFSTVAFNYIELDTFRYGGPGRSGTVGKFSADGELQWFEPFAGVERGHLCTGVMLDKFSNVYTVGRFNSSITLVKRNKDGALLWVNSPPAGSTALGAAEWNDLYVNEFGDIYTVGSYSGTANFGINILNGTHLYEDDHVFAKYNTKGEMLWVKPIPGDGRDVLLSITGFQNKLFLGGYSRGVIGSQSIPFENYLSVFKYEEETINASFYDQELSLFPNPNSGQFCAYLNTDFQRNVEVVVYDILGQVLYEKHYDELFGLRPFIAITLPESIVPGHYIFTVKSGEKEKALIFAVY